MFLKYRRHLTTLLWLLSFFALTESPLCAQSIAGLVDVSTPGIIGANSFVIAQNGEALLYNYEAGLDGIRFLTGVYKSFGISHDFRYFLYLKAKGHFPTFQLYSYEFKTRKETQLTDAAVHNAVWS